MVISYKYKSLENVKSLQLIFLAPDNLAPDNLALEKWCAQEDGSGHWNLRVSIL